MKMAALTVIVVAVLCFMDHVKCNCNSNLGPSGETVCVLLKPYYSEYQYATCLTNSYIQARSNGNHACRNSTRYCYYQCMLELNNLDEGPVYKNCSCSPNLRVTQQSVVLPDWCYSPDGTSCQWYGQCLEKRYLCSDEENLYALDFGEKFCSLYEQHSSRFDQVSRTWINPVRKCLQVKLVDLLRPYQHPSCDEIKTRALGSHSGCYHENPDGVPSLCDIGFENWLRVLVTVHSSLTYKKVIGEVLVTAGECFRLYMNRTVILIVSWREKQPDKLQKMILDVTDAANERLADDVFMIVLNSDELTDTRSRRSTTQQSFNSSIELLMVPRNKHDLNYRGRSTRTTEQLITSFLDHVDAGEITYDALDGVQLLEYRECDNAVCDTPLRTVMAPPPNTAVAPVAWFLSKFIVGAYILAVTIL